MNTTQKTLIEIKNKLKEKAEVLYENEGVASFQQRCGIHDAINIINTYITPIKPNIKK